MQVLLIENAKTTLKSIADLDAIVTFCQMGEVCNLASKNIYDIVLLDLHEDNSECILKEFALLKCNLPTIALIPNNEHLKRLLILDGIEFLLKDDIKDKFHDTVKKTHERISRGINKSIKMLKKALVKLDINTEAVQITTSACCR